ENYSYLAPTAQDACLAGVLDFIHHRKIASLEAPGISNAMLNWSSSPLPPKRYSYSCGEEQYDVSVQAKDSDNYIAECGGGKFEIIISNDGARAVIKGVSVEIAAFLRVASVCFLAVGGRDLRFDNRVKLADGEGTAAGGLILSPMHGNLVEVNVKAGSKVTADTRLATLEAMKMRHEILAGVKGTVKEIFHKPGTQVGAGEKLFEIEVKEKDNATGE
ncbi:MAG: hypothetical protein L3J32_10050, partial [Rhizobiaceae bacterium]|nr:hypothetical protein [Rhizobiaceae bacterium]